MKRTPSGEYSLRMAVPSDVPALERLIPVSVRGLQSGYYTEAQREAALGLVFAVDRQLIAEGTYFVMEREGDVVACGGWSRRAAEFGGDRVRSGDNAVLEPGRDPARVRAFFVHPACSRRGLGRAILRACEAAMVAEGFRRATLVATLAGEPLYAAAGYAVAERYEVPLPGGLRLPVVRMMKELGPGVGGG